MNDGEREQWVANDEGLHVMYERWRRRNKGGMRGFLREHRDLIDEAAGNVVSGARRHHYLRYG